MSHRIGHDDDTSDAETFDLVTDYRDRVQGREAELKHLVYEVRTRDNLGLMAGPYTTLEGAGTAVRETLAENFWLADDHMVIAPRFGVRGERVFDRDLYDRLGYGWTTLTEGRWNG